MRLRILPRIVIMMPICVAACGDSGEGNPIYGDHDAGVGGASGASGSPGQGGSAIGGTGGEQGGTGAVASGGEGGVGAASGSGGASGESGAGGYAGGTGGSNTGGSSGSNTGGTGGSNTGGSSGSNTGGTGGSNTGGSSGSNIGGSAGSGGCTTVWCLDGDGDTYGDPSTKQVNCTAPGPTGWIQEGSKPAACADCADGVKTAFPGSTYCGATPFVSNGGYSFDYNCDGYETECGQVQKAVPGCVLGSGGGCTGSGYLPTGTGKNPYCGSTTWQYCAPGAGSLCTATLSTNFNPITCK